MWKSENLCISASILITIFCPKGNRLIFHKIVTFWIFSFIACHLRSKFGKWPSGQNQYYVWVYLEKISQKAPNHVKLGVRAWSGLGREERSFGRCPGILNTRTGDGFLDPRRFLPPSPHHSPVPTIPRRPKTGSQRNKFRQTQARIGIRKTFASMFKAAFLIVQRPDCF